MRKRILLSSLAVIALAILFLPAGPVFAQAENVCSTVASLYRFSLMIAGALAMGAIVYGGFKYTISAGNPSGQSEGKDRVKGALLGLLLIVSAVIILNTINPEITQCKLPKLDVIPGTPPPGTVSCAVTINDPSTGKVCANNTVADCSQCTVEAQCAGNPNCTVSCGRCSESTANCIQTYGTNGQCNPAVSCKASPQLNTALGCISGKGLGPITATYGGTHKCDLITNSISCHFGGTSCKDGGHAFDVVRPSLLITWVQTRDAAKACASSCYCEGRDALGDIFRDPSCTDSRIDHVHCNVGSCGCS